jgi:hypothetical protein
VYAADTTRDRTWQLLGALFVSSWAASLLAHVLLGAIPGRLPGLTAMLMTALVGTALQAVALRWALPQIAGVQIRFLDACAVAALGQLPLVLLFAPKQLPLFGPAITSISLLLPLAALALQYFLLRALVGSAVEPGPAPIVEALARVGTEPDYASVLSGIRETVAAVDQAFVSPAAPGEAVLDELTALAAHERRLRTLRAPDLRAAEAHEALLTALAAYQDELLVASEEGRTQLQSAGRLRELVAELAAFV